METIVVDQNIPLICVPAASFPAGIQAAFEALDKKIQNRARRNMYGISYIDGQGRISYKAAATALHLNEAEKLGCEQDIVEAGTYLKEVVMSFMQDIPAVGQAFQRLLADPKAQGQTKGVEWYQSEREVWCMVRVE